MPEFDQQFWRKLWRRIDKTSHAPCWIWTGTLSMGYGQVQIDNVVYYVHRLLFEELVGPVPHKHVLHHTCPRRNCANPEHLEVLSYTEHLAAHPRKRGRSRRK